MKFTLHIWRQEQGIDKGRFETHIIDNITPDMSFLEMLDVLNLRLEEEGKDPIAFDSDCREGICGMCSLVINGAPHGTFEKTTTCQLHMRMFQDGQEIYIEPWRAKAFPVIKDLIVDRSALDRIIQAGGFVSIRAGSAQDANNIPIAKDNADAAMDAAACIGCGACVAACPNASAMLFTAAKISHLSFLPQGQPERYNRAKSMVKQMDEEGFGGCTNTGECQEACPKGISLNFIAIMNRDFLKANICDTGKKGEKIKSQ